MNFSRKKHLFFTILIATIFSTSIFAQQQALDLALRHLQQERENLKLTQDDIDNFRVSDLYSSKHNGVTHIYLNQQTNGIDAMNAIININVMPDGKILNMGNRFIPNIKERAKGSLSISAEEALRNALSVYNIPAPAEIRILERISDKEIRFDGEGIALGPIPVKAVYVLKSNKTVQLAWQMEIQELSGQNWWNTLIDASNGDFISHRDMIIKCAFDNGEGMCSIEKHQHAYNKLKKEKSQTTSTSLTNSYHVLPIPFESPNHGDRQIIANPADPEASPFGWHDTDGQDGAEFTITRGNNTHAYHDIFAINTSLGDEPDGGPSLDFDFPFDENITTPYAQVDAAITNLFYWNNMMHDVWYNYGFDEESGNFQANNYGNGGQQGDYVRAEGLDGTSINNANFGTGADGSQSRMQMFIWTNEGLPPREVPPMKVKDLDGNVTEYEITPAVFGELLPLDPIIAEVALVDDGTDPTSDACEDIMNDVQGKIALLDRGDCEFGFKVLKAEQAGAIAVVVCNNIPDPLTLVMGPGDMGDAVTIPSVMISQADCEEIKLNLDDISTFELKGNFDIPIPGPNGRDGDFDNGIVAHEYTHGISIRLTGGPSSPGCLIIPEQAGEGWSDWFSLVMTTSPQDSANQRRGIGTFAAGQPVDGRGIRSFPYSRDMSVDPHTYSNINGESVPHGVGSVWAVMIWDLYWNLVDVYGFDEDLINGTGGNNIAMQLVLDGLKLQPCNPTFIDARNAIISADFANNGGANSCLIWQTFARRGLGKEAVSGGVESFDVVDVCNMALKLKKTGAKEVNAGGEISYTLRVENDFPEALTNVVITDIIPEGTTYVDESSSCENTTFADNTLTIVIGAMDIGSTATCTYKLKVDASLASSVIFEDGVEDGQANWDIESPVGTSTWTVNSNSFSGDFSFFAADTENQSDQMLTLAEPLFIESETQVLSFWHSYNTERDWDGGVVEISTDGSAWEDAGPFMIQNGYDGPIMDNPDSPISSREAFNGNSFGFQQTLIEVGNWSGQEIFVRFRMACDAFVGAEGWYVDDIQLFGEFNSITNEACISSDLGENFCSLASSVVTGSGTSPTYEVANDQSFTIFPNPSDGKFEIRITDQTLKSTNIRIMGIDGRQLINKPITGSSGTYQMDLSELGSGMYVLILETENASLVKKIVIQ